MYWIEKEKTPNRLQIRARQFGVLFPVYYTGKLICPGTHVPDPGSGTQILATSNVLDTYRKQAVRNLLQDY